MSLYDVPQMAKRSDIDHSVAMAIVSTAERKGFAVAAVWSASGDVLAADGWFYDEALPTVTDAPALVDLDWEDWDDMPSKLLWRANVAWYDSLFPYLARHYSFARGVAELLLHWGHEPGRPEVERNTELVAYFPVPDRDMIASHLRRAHEEEAQRDSWLRTGKGSRSSNAELGLALLEAGLQGDSSEE